mmetsp:Transcript_27144/g.24011  ORF Transcript_27144/g.24011 Transcript_27144/m.24011 type:complete len:266 (+) Transcript_27144:85-882(+)|eukprot:CAMPEP_0114586270 /NCGR_PEP_ID=MMETSP0125-20121206/9543_1 /TAXON_ID=485358 ORGANISM="Aristerostoma sp., Strain ATCC 50986" /NCGR_SAMPLE_ID=MMETSP0125 /ASSEMBLY_ACC=CAM_ASM_000245 /LENGTH=265 /DNA_ID=CAMNT_0001781639 /DNA_START=83 /DNA_END=880 /DNA_ORIENTATION=+
MAIIENLTTAPEVALVGSAMVIGYYALFELAAKTIKIPKFSHQKSLSIALTFPALLHDIMVIVFPVLYWITHGPTLHKYGDLWNNIMNLDTSAYFLVHGIILKKYNMFTTNHAIHHIATIVCAFGVTITGETPVGVAVEFCLHLSHIPLHMRCILRDFGLKYTSAYEYVEAFYFGVYAFERTVGLTYLMKVSIFDVQVNMFLNIMLCAIYIQSIVFIYQIVLLTLKKYKNYKERVKTGIKYEWMTECPDAQYLSYYRKEKKEKIF